MNGRRGLWGPVSLAALLVLASLLLGLLLGRWGGANLELLQSEETALLRDQVALLEQQLAALRQLHANSQTRNEVDDVALELVRAELAQQRQTIAELEQGLRFYRSLMAPEEISRGLSVRSFDIQPGSSARHYLFRLVVQQQARKHEQVSGELTVLIEGELGGEPASLELSALSEQVPRPGIRLRFKYFQAIEGELVLPEGFHPYRVAISGEATKPRSEEISGSFAWPDRLSLSAGA
jgi:hypothetical protein